jgi:hypothetical protein
MKPPASATRSAIEGHQQRAAVARRMCVRKSGAPTSRRQSCLFHQAHAIAVQSRAAPAGSRWRSRRPRRASPREHRIVLAAPQAGAAQLVENGVVSGRTQSRPRPSQHKNTARRDPAMHRPSCTCRPMVVDFGSITQEETMQFGYFTMPSHPPERPLKDGHEWDLQVIRWLDELGFAECWIGEHHTAPLGTASLARPAGGAGPDADQEHPVGPGWLPAAYHHPAELANRHRHARHISGGRLNFGVAASGLPATGRCSTSTACRASIAT